MMLTLNGRAALVAATADKPAHLGILVDASGLLTFQSWGRLLLNLFGVVPGARVPVIASPFEVNRREVVIVQGVPRLNDWILNILAPFEGNEAAQEVQRLLAEGTDLQAGVLIFASKVSKLKAGDFAIVNGQTWELDQPTAFIENWSLKNVRLLAPGGQLGRSRPGTPRISCGTFNGDEAQRMARSERTSSNPTEVVT